MSREYPHFYRVTSLLGLIGAVAAYPLVILAVIQSPWFDLFSNALSDLGRYSNYPGNVYFNAGLILSGLLTSVFAISLIVSVKSISLETWKYTLLIATVSLIAIGLFPEDLGALHLVPSVTFFASLPLTILIYGTINLYSGRKAVGVEALILSSACIGVWTADWSWSGVAIQELITSIIGSYWIVKVIASLSH
ncbi:MAG: DUF998 domain-containing protein [Aigarchaeota archaeon]|nr:DUF998 domain-containing protein [Aigarchaeota archaeon]MDW8092881.1 DUF998 domain-containing protein [Nitrososphaerota archaeon]